MDLGLTGTPFFDTLILGAGAGLAAHIAAFILQGRLPGEGFLAWVLAGGVFGALFYVFQSGLS